MQTTGLLKRSLRGAALGALLAASAVAVAAPASAQALFSAPERLDGGSVSFSSATQGQPIQAGSDVNIAGRGFQPGQSVTLFYGKTPLTAAPLVAAEDGTLTGTLKVPANAQSGIHTVVAVTEAPYKAQVVDLKVSPTIALSGAENYTITSNDPAPGLYQTAYSAKNKAIFTTSSIGRPPIKQSELVRLDAKTLKVEARVTPAAAPPRELPPNAPADASTDGGVFGVYGVGVDDKNNTVWVTNTRQNTVAVYSQKDLKLVKQFEPGLVNHSRDVVVDETVGKAYASATFAPEVVVFNTAKTEFDKKIAIQSTKRGETFSAASLSLDRKAHRLYIASNATNEVAVIDTKTDEVLNVFAVPGARSVIGVSHDPETDRIFAAAQGSDNLVVLNGADGSVIADTPVGAGALNAVFDPVKRLVYVSNFNNGTIAVLDVDGKIVANLDGSPVANHVSTDGQGNVYAVIKTTRDGKSERDTVVRIAPKR